MSAEQKKSIFAALGDFPETLTSLLKKRRHWHEKRLILIAIAQQLSYMASCKIAHGQLALNSCRFGRKKEEFKALIMRPVGTSICAYQPIEYWMGDQTPSLAGDVWSFGAMIVHVMSRIPMLSVSLETYTSTHRTPSDRNLVLREFCAFNAAIIMLEFGLPDASSHLLKLPHWNLAKKSYDVLLPTYKMTNYNGIFAGKPLWEMAKSMLAYDPKARMSARDVHDCLKYRIL
jgi:hypothetical protein